MTVKGSELVRSYVVVLENGTTIALKGPGGVAACRAHNETASEGEKAVKYQLPGLPNAWIHVAVAS